MKLDISGPKRQVIDIGKTIASHHSLIMMLLILGVMIYTVFTVSAILSQPSDDAYRAEKQAAGAKTSFDEETIKKINDLNQDNNAGQPTLPGGRINPFVE